MIDSANSVDRPPILSTPSPGAGTGLPLHVIRAFETAKDGDTAPLPPPPPSHQSKGGAHLLSVFEPPAADGTKCCTVPSLDDYPVKPPRPAFRGGGGSAGPGSAGSRPRIPNTAFDVLAGRPVGAFRGHVLQTVGNFWNTMTTTKEFSGKGLHRVASEEWR